MIPIKTNDNTREHEDEPTVVSGPVNNTDARATLYSETEVEKYERQIQELTDHIEDFDYTIESLQNKNTKMEEEHKELPKLRTKVEQLRNSKTMFIAQIKEVQKREKEWMRKAEENEQKYKKLLSEMQQGNAQTTKLEDSPKKEKDNKTVKQKVRGARHGRKPSVQMPTPDSANTVSIGSQPTPNVGDGSAQTVSMSSLNNSTDTDGNNSIGKSNRKRFPRW